MNKVLFGVLAVLMVAIVFQLSYLIFSQPTPAQPAPALPTKTADLSDKPFAKGWEKFEEVFTSYQPFIRSVDFEIEVEGEIASIEKNTLLLTKEKKQLAIELDERTAYLGIEEKNKKVRLIKKEDLPRNDTDRVTSVFDLRCANWTATLAVAPTRFDLPTITVDLAQAER